MPTKMPGETIERTIVIDGEFFKGRVVGQDVQCIAPKHVGDRFVSVITNLKRLPLVYVNVASPEEGNTSEITYGCLDTSDFVEWCESKELSDKVDTSYLNQKDDNGLPVIIAIKRIDLFTKLSVPVNIR